jgi:hypothetical protein
MSDITYPSDWFVPLSDFGIDDVILIVIISALTYYFLNKHNVSFPAISTMG